MRFVFKLVANLCVYMKQIVFFFCLSMWSQAARAAKSKSRDMDVEALDSSGTFLSTGRFARKKRRVFWHLKLAKK